MATKKQMKFKPRDHKEFVVASVTRGDIRVLFGNRVADKLSRQDMKEIAKELAETYIGYHWYEELGKALSTGFDVKG
jgi:hypothetical protein